jgi:hypothetical protein
MKTLKSRSIVLIGDSIFDNAAYTKGEPNASEHLCNLVVLDRGVILLAKDGATTARIPAGSNRESMKAKKPKRVPPKDSCTPT